MKTTVLAAGQSCPAVRHAVPAEKHISPSRIRQRLTVALFSLAVFGAPPAMAKDPCKSVLCLFGKFTGDSGGSECSGAELDYFSILIKKKGKIKWSQTASAREQFLNSCSAADKGVNKKINSKFGRVFG